MATANCAQVSKFLIGEKKAIRELALVRDENGTVTLAVTVWLPTGSQPPYKAVVVTCAIDEAARLGIMAALDWKGTSDDGQREKDSARESGAIVGPDSRHAGNGGVGGTTPKGGKVS